MKPLQYFIFITSLLLISARMVTSTEPQFSKPKLVLQGNAGDQPGEFGYYNRGDFYIADFEVDIHGNIWIMDIGNQRVQKFNEKGDYVLSFPNEKNKAPIDFRCRYSETDLKGNIYAGIRNAKLIVIQNDGTFLKTIKLPGVKENVGFDFAVNHKSHILYRGNVGHDLISLDIEGKVNYAMKNGPSISGRHTTPYSPYLNNYNSMTKEATIYPKGLRKSVKEGLTVKLPFKDLKFDTNVKYGGELLLIDNNQHVFIESNVNSREQITYHNEEGELLTTLTRPTNKIKAESHPFNSYALDKEGNFYLLQHFKPDEESIISVAGSLDRVYSDSPCLYVWKWERLD